MRLSRANKVISALLLSALSCFAQITVTPSGGGGGGGGTVTSIGVTTANGISGTSSGGSTPSLTLSLGSITPTSVAISGTSPISLTYGAATSGAFDSIFSNTNETAVPRPARTVTDGVTTTSSPTVTSATANFTAFDLHHAITGSGIPASTFIGLVNSLTSIGLSSSSSSNVPVNITGSGATGVSLTIAAQPSQVLGSYEITTALFAGSNGAGRRDNVWQFGYNNPNSPNYVANDDSFDLTFENSYTTVVGLRQGEFYFTAASGDGVLNIRPFSITAAWDSHIVDVASRGTHFIIGDSGNNNDWLTATSTPTSGTLSLTGNSKIGYSGSVTDFITSAGVEISGYDQVNSEGRLGAGPAINRISANQDPTATDITLGFGQRSNNRRIIYNHSTGNFQATDDGSTFYNLNAYGTYANANTISAVTLTNIAGDWAQLGYVTNAVENNEFVEITLASKDGNGISQKYAIPFTTNTNRDGSGLTYNVWYECIPLATSNGDGENVVLDVMPRPFSNPKVNTFRVRRKVAGSATLTVAGDVKLSNVGGETWTNSHATGSSGVVSGMLPNQGGPLIVTPLGRVTAQRAANSSIATYTVGGADGSFEVSMNMNVTAATVLSTSMNCTYTDESNTSRTMIFPTTSLSGSFLSGGLVTATGAFETPVMHIRCKAGTTITLLTATGTFSSVTYTAEGIIKQTK